MNDNDKKEGANRDSYTIRNNGESPGLESQIKQKRKPLYKIILFLILLLITSLFIVKLVELLQFETLKQALFNTSFGLIILAWGFYLIAQYLRSLQFYYTFSRRISKGRLFIINSYYNTFSQMIPYRVGELSMLYYVKEEDVRTGHSLGAIIVIKLIDFIVATLFYILFLYYSLPLIKRPFLFQLMAIILIVISSLSTFFLIKINLFQRGVLYFSQGKWGKHVKPLFTSLLKVIDAIRNIRNELPYRHYFFLGILIRTCHLLMAYFTYLAIHTPLSPSLIILNELFMSFVSLIPLSILANFGYYELTFSALVREEGISIDGLNYGFLRHLFDIFYLFAYQFVGFLLQFFTSSPKPSKFFRKNRKSSLSP